MLPSFLAAIMEEEGEEEGVEEEEEKKKGVERKEKFGTPIVAD